MLKAQGPVPRRRGRWCRTTRNQGRHETGRVALRVENDSRVARRPPSLFAVLLKILLLAPMSRIALSAFKDPRPLLDQNKRAQNAGESFFIPLPRSCSSPRNSPLLQKLSRVLLVLVPLHRQQPLDSERTRTRRSSRTRDCYTRSSLP